jgi:hypothetical protein
MQGGTRAAEQFLVVTIHYELDGVVGPNNKPLRVSVDGVVAHAKADHDILISEKS